MWPFVWKFAHPCSSQSHRWRAKWKFSMRPFRNMLSGPVKSGTVLPTGRHHCGDLSSCVFHALSPGDGSRLSSHASRITPIMKFISIFKALKSNLETTFRSVWGHWTTATRNSWSLWPPSPPTPNTTPTPLIMITESSLWSILLCWEQT